MVMPVFGSDGTDPEEDTGVLEYQDTLDQWDGVSDVLAAGWSPAERPWAVDDWGVTEWEERTGESLDGRLGRELPDGRADEGDGLGDASDTDGELLDEEVGGSRAGRLAETETAWGDVREQFYAVDVGIDGAAASAEEAAIHLVDAEDRPTEKW